MDKIVEWFEKKNIKRIKDMGDFWSMKKRLHDLEEFYDFIFQYFELDKLLQDRDYEHKRDFYKQKHEVLNYFELLLTEIKPYLFLALEMSNNGDIDKKFKKKEIKENSIVNMIENFIRLRRTGRNRIYYPHEREEFEKFKEKYSNIVEFLKHIDSFDGKTTGSILDHGKAIIEFKIDKKQLREYQLQLNHWVRDCSRATKYRLIRI